MCSKSLIFFVAAFAASVLAAEDKPIDFSKVILRTEVPGFWDGRLVKPMTYEKNSNHKFDRNGRIVGGVEADPHSHPYQAGLLIEVHWWTSFCGGNLISPNLVITAAHCPESSSSTQVVLGAHRVFAFERTQITRMVLPSSYIFHPQYDPVMLYNDLALLVLTSSVEFNNYIQPIQLPPYEMLRKDFAGEIATVSGEIFSSSEIA
jgi:hypothetical protein